MDKDSHCPCLLPAKPQPRERAWRNQRGKKTLFELDSSPTLRGAAPLFGSKADFVGRSGRKTLSVGSLAVAARALLKITQCPKMSSTRTKSRVDKRVKARLILISSTNTNRESVAYRSFRPSEFEAKVSEKLPQANWLVAASVHSDVAF
ncbi:hypothetical protein KIW84_UN0763 [Lathyrus oleraceus]|nr:hypothetical protein KIW84_UN0763 [Pisum sativum]